MTSQSIASKYEKQLASFYNIFIIRRPVGSKRLAILYKQNLLFL